MTFDDGSVRRSLKSSGDDFSVLMKSNSRALGKLPFLRIFVWVAILLSLLACGGLLVDNGNAPLSGFYVYTANFGSDNITQFAADKEGNLKKITQYATGHGPISIVGSGLKNSNGNTRRVVYVANFSDQTISSYTITCAGLRGPGRLVPLAVTSVGAYPTVLLADQYANHLYCTCNNSNELVDFAIDPDSGVLTQLKRVATGHGPIGVGINGQGAFVCNSNDGTMSSYTLPSLTPWAIPSIVTGTGARQVITARYGVGLYSLNRSEGTISMFAEDIDKQGNDILKDKGKVRLPGPSPSIAAFIPNSGNNDYLYVTNRGNNTVTALKHDVITGILTLTTIPDAASGILPNDLQAGLPTPNQLGKLLYEADDSGEVRGYYQLTDGSLLHSGTFVVGGYQPRALLVSDDIGPSYTQGELQIVTGDVPNGKIGTPYKKEILTSFWAILLVASGSLPPGLTITYDNENNLSYISGTPTAAGTYNFDLKGWAGYQSATMSYHMTVAP